MRVHALGHLEAARHEQRRPDHRVEPQDLLADHVVLRRPEPRAILGERAVWIAQTERGRVVEERVDPHIDHMLGSVGHPDAPCEVRARDWHILQAIAHAPEHFVEPAIGSHEPRVRGEERLKLRLIRAQPEVVVLLRRAHEWLAADRRLVLKLLGAGVGDIFLLPLVVPTSELAEVDVARLHQLLNEELDLRLVPRLGGADEVVVGQPEQAHDLAELGRVLVGERLRADAAIPRALLNLQPVLVGSGQEEDIPPIKPHCPRPDIAEGRGVRMPDMRAIVDVVDGRGDVRRRRTGHIGILQTAAQQSAA